MRAHITDAEIVSTLKVVESEGGQRAAARKLGINPQTVNNYCRVAEKRGLTASTPILDKAQKLEMENSQLKKDVEALQLQHDSDQNIRTEVFGLAARPPEPPDWLWTKLGKNGARGTPMTLWSDWHFGEVVLPEEVGGTNAFNAAVCEARVKRLVNTTVDLCFNHMGRAKTDYPGIVVGVNGDMMTGMIHDELLQTNDRTPQEQVNDLTDIICSALEALAVKFGKVCVFWTVGNHGRGTLKPRMKARVRTSFEWIIGTSVERHFRKSKNVTIIVPLETDAYYKVYGTRFLQTHGDNLGVKGGDGIIGAIGPIMRGSIKVGRSEAQVGRDFDCLLLGHWHQMLWLPGVIVNNSLKGYDEFARLALRAPYSRPSQALWFVHPEHGITAKWEIFLEAQRGATDENEWLTWQQRKTA